MLAVVVDSSAPRAYGWGVTLVNFSTLSGLWLRGRTSKDVLSRCIEPWAPPHPVFYGLFLNFAKRARWICGRTGEMDVRFQERCVTGSKARKDDRVRTVAICFATF